MTGNLATLEEFAEDAKAWPFKEARNLVKRFEKNPPANGTVLFETGYGPSGLPHIGTFGEVARTTMVRRAFSLLSDLPTRLVAFSDDMDGLRKVPANIPGSEAMAAHLGMPLSSVPDPFGTHESFGHHNNARLRAFLDAFGFDYEFKSATEAYQSGELDAALLDVLRNYDKIMAVTLPTLGAERQATYSPFLPLCPRTGQVLQVPITARDVDAGTVCYRDENGKSVEVPVTGGHCKLQWKADWAMRWHALGVHYEMAGKDLISSVELSGKICRILGSTPPEGFNYELFLDENGEKISKSRGNGLTIDDWLRYGTRESLSLYMFATPRRAKRLHFDVIPRHVDDYLSHLTKFADLDLAAQLENPVWHIHPDALPSPETGIGYAILLNLASVCNTEDPSVLWGFISRYVPDATPENAPILNQWVALALNYYRDFVKPNKTYRQPNEMEVAALQDLIAALGALPPDASAEAIQSEVYEVGKRHEFENLRDWFKALYETLLGQEQGPRMGSFIVLYGISETVTLIKRVLAGDDLAAYTKER